MVWHGLSSKPPFADTMPVFCDQLLDLMDALGLAKVSIEGESMGGHIAMYFALHHPDKVNKLILNTAAGVQYDEGTVQMDPARGRDLLRQRSLDAVNNPTEETIRKRLEWLMASPDRVTGRAGGAAAALYSKPRPGAALRRTCSTTRSAPRPRPSSS